MINKSYNQKKITEYWEEEVCGTRGILENNISLETHIEISNYRYKVEPYLKKFVKFKGIKKNSKILEIGIGAGSDFIELCKQGGRVYGIDATSASIDIVRKRLKFEKFDNYEIKLNNAKELDFESNFFNYVYSYGVIHHAEETLTILSEIKRVSKPGAVIKIMVYSNFNMVGIILYLYKAITRLKFFTSQEDLIYDNLESPGTKSYSVKEISKVLKSFGFKNISVKKQIGNGDLLNFPPSNKYNKNIFFKIFTYLYPRFLIKKLNFLGLLLLIEFEKPLE